MRDSILVKMHDTFTIAYGVKESRCKYLVLPPSNFWHIPYLLNWILFMLSHKIYLLLYMMLVNLGARTPSHFHLISGVYITS